MGVFRQFLLQIWRPNALERTQRVSSMTRHPELVVEGSTDYALFVYDVSHSGRAESESASHVVKAAYISRGVASKLKRNSKGVTEALHPICAVGAYAYDNRVTCQQLIISFAETPDLVRSSVSENPNEEEKDDIASYLLRESELFAGT